MKHDSPEFALFLKRLWKDRVFTRKHLVALSGINENTMKTYMPYLLKQVGTRPAARRATYFTGIEAMAVMLMVRIQSEWDLRPEKSFELAWQTAFKFSYAVAEHLRSPTPWLFDKGLAAAIYSPAGLSQLNFSFGEEFTEELLTVFSYEINRGSMCFIGFKLNLLWQDVFDPVLEAYMEITGQDLVKIVIEESRRDDALKN